MKVPPEAVLNIIRENLNDRYHKGFPILKELVQNADDAGATQLHFGWVNALVGVEHPLLGGPALFVVNDGAFTATDGEAIDCIGLSSKTGNKVAVGKFGLGLKSIFHICEAFFYVAIDNDTGQRVGHVVNPWADGQGHDRYHEGWDSFTPTDQEIIRTHLNQVLNPQRFFCLWIPLRQQAHRQNRAPITQDYPGDTDHPPEFLTNGTDIQLAALLPMLRSLQQVTIWKPGNNRQLIPVVDIQLGAKALRRRYPNDSKPEQRLELKGSITIKRSQDSANESHKFTGFEQIRAAPDFKCLQESKFWPRSSSTDAITGEPVNNPDKADAHCAVYFREYPAQEAGTLGVTVAVFLPVDEPGFSAIALKTAGLNVTLTLHGYFFLDAGRSRIEGLDTRPDIEPHDEPGLRAAWNARLFQMGTLPLVLPALKQFVEDARLSREKVEALTQALQESELFTNARYRNSICGEHQWVCCITSPGKRDWQLLRASERVFEIPAPPAKDLERPFVVLPFLKQVKYLTFQGLPRLTAQEAQAWDIHISKLLQNVSIDKVFGQKVNLDYFLTFLAKCVGSAITTQPDVVTQLLQLVRQAFQQLDLATLGSYRALVQRFIGLIPPEQRFVLRVGESLEKSDGFESVMQDLLQEKNLSVLLVPGGFDASKTAANRLSTNDAATLLKRLARFRPKDQSVIILKSAIALKVVETLHAADKTPVLEQCQSLPLFRGYDFKTDGEVLLRFHELQDLLAQKTLFRRANPLDNPKTEGETERLYKALPHGRVVLVTRDVADPLFGKDVGTCTARACIEALAARPPLSAAYHRVDLLKSLLGQLEPLDEPTNRQAIRYLLHGEKQRYDTGEPLLVGDIKDPQNVWARLTRCILDLDKSGWRVIDPVLSEHLTGQHYSQLGLSPIDQRGVEGLLKEPKQFAAVNQLHLTSDDCDTLLRDLTAPESLKQLQIHETVDGRRVVIDAMTYYRSGNQSPDLSPDLAQHITLLCYHANPDLRKKQEALANPLTPDIVIAVALQQTHPGLYWQDIMNALADESIQLDERLRVQLSQKRWLPLKPEDMAEPPMVEQPPAPLPFTYVAPQDVCYLPGLDNAEIARLVTRDDAMYDVAQLNHDLRQHPAFDRLSKSGIFPKQHDALDMLGLILVEHAEYRLGAIEALDKNSPNAVENLDRFRSVFKDGEASLMPAYPIIDAVCHALSPTECVNNLLPHILEPLPTERMADLLNFLARQHRSATDKKNKADALEVHAWYLTTAVKMPEFATDILPQIELLNQLDAWKPPTALCYDVPGIDGADLLSERHGKIIRPSRFDTDAASEVPTDVNWPGGSLDEQLAQSVHQLRAYFKAWKGALTYDEVIGGVLCLLGDHRDIKVLTKGHLGQRDIRSVREMVAWESGGRVPKIHDAMRRQRFVIAIATVDAKTRPVKSLTGQAFDAHLVEEKDLKNLIVGDEQKKYSPRLDDENKKQINYLCLRELNPTRHSPEKLSNLLLETARWILQRIYGQQTPNLSRVWEELENSEQLDIQLTQRLLLDSVFFYLKQLGIQTNSDIKAVLKAWNDAHRQSVEQEQLREMGRPAPDLSQVKEAKSEAVERLRQLIEENSTAQYSFLTAVRAKVEQYQYKPQSIPFELFQNADDAVVELEQATQTEVSRSCVVAWTPTHISLWHWGRPINEFRFDNFDGRDQGYDRDLEKMLVLSYSDKATENGVASVTGKFGLGFKSVFLITDQPHILSGRLGFKIVGGIYPQRLVGEPFKRLRARIAEESPDKSQRGTLFDLPVGVAPNDVMGEFGRLVHILVVFSQRIRQCKLYPGVADSVSVSWQSTPVLEHQQMHTGQLQPIINAQLTLTQNQPALVCEAAGGKLLLQLDARGFAPFPGHVPTLWVTAPTQEKLDLGFVLNGPFHLDVGRAQLARVSDYNRQLAETMGDALATNLARLCADSQAQWPALREALLLAQDATAYNFWESLWQMVGEGLSPHIKRDMTALQTGQASTLVELLQVMLWGTATTPRGMGQLVAEHPALPSQLPGKHRVLTSTKAVKYTASGVLSKDNKIFVSVAAWPTFEKKVQPGTIISDSVKRILETLLPGSLDR